jgi:hypothetical protein
MDRYELERLRRSVALLPPGHSKGAVTRPDGHRELDGLDISFGESPRFNGRAVVALATDPGLAAFRGILWVTRRSPTSGRAWNGSPTSRPTCRSRDGRRAGRPPHSLQSLRQALNGCTPEEITAIVSTTAAGVYSFDLDALGPV